MHQTSARVTTPVRRWTLPVALGLVAMFGTVVALLLDLGSSGAERAAASMGWGAQTAAVGVVLVVAGVAILATYPRHRVGWVLAVFGLVWVVDGVLESWVTRAVAADPDLPLAGFGLWFVAQLGSVLLVALPLVLVLYPHGTLMQGRWRTVGMLTVAMACALPLALVVAPPSVMDFGGDLPASTGMPALPLAEGPATAVLLVARFLTLVSLLLAVLLVFVRHRQTTGVERRQLKWLVWAAIVCVISTVVALIVPTGGIALLVLVVCLVVTSASVAIGILAPDVTDVDALMGGTLIYAAVAGAVVTLDLALLALVNETLGERLDERQSALLVLLVAVAAYGPLRAWIGAGVRRFLVGRRGERYAVVSSLAARLEESGDLPDQLPALARAVADAFKISWVRVEVDDHAGRVLSATHGTPPRRTRTLPISYGDEEVGRLELPEEGIRAMLSRRDRDLLLDVVRQAAIAIRSSRLARELQASREQLVLTREEDRRRIRRDLHDGLGPVLGGVAMRLDAAGALVETDPGRSREMIAHSRADLTEALADVRRLVHGLRPPALDDLGLVAAVEQQADRVRSSSLQVAVTAEALPPLPAAVEVAAYRIVSEAMANVVRHAGASRCDVRLAGTPGVLELEVVDDGRGVADGVAAGVGLLSLRERAEELGGRHALECPPDGGTRVRAWLPVPTEPREGER